MSSSEAVRILENDGLGELRREFPEYVLWFEQTPRRAQYVARCLHLHAQPHTLVTTDLTELRDALQQTRTGRGQAPDLHHVVPLPGTKATRAVPTSPGLIQAGRELMARTVDLPSGRRELLGVLSEYRRVLFALTVQGVEH